MSHKQYPGRARSGIKRTENQASPRQAGDQAVPRAGGRIPRPSGTRGVPALSGKTPMAKGSEENADR